MKKRKNSYVGPFIRLLTCSSDGNGILAASGKYGVNVDSKDVTPSNDAIDGNPDDIDAKEHQSWGAWDE